MKKKNVVNNNKSNSQDNKKNNGLISDSMTMNKKTFSNKKNIIKKNIINNKLKNYNDKKNFISNYAQIYLRKNFFEKELIKNRIIYNKSVTGLTKLKK